VNQALNLRWSDFCADNNSIRLRSEYSKTRLEWCVPIPESLKIELLDLRKRVYEASPLHAMPEEFIFVISLFQQAGKIGRATTQSDVKKFMIGYSLIVGEKISAHRIRHTTASQLARNVPNIKSVQQILGHKSITTTLKYIHPTADDLRKAASVL
jgi:integrase